jgi:hypothetical protein
VRVPAIAVVFGLVASGVAVIAIVAALKPPVPGSAASFRAMSSASSGSQPAYSVPVDERRNSADTCRGYNLELEEAAGIQRRIGHVAEAERLLAMRQNCAGANPNLVRSAR